MLLEKVIIRDFRGIEHREIGFTDALGRVRTVAPADGWTLFKGRILTQRNLYLDSVSPEQFESNGGVFQFDQQRRGLAKRISRIEKELLSVSIDEHYLEHSDQDNGAKECHSLRECRLSLRESSQALLFHVATVPLDAQRLPTASALDVAAASSRSGTALRRTTHSTIAPATGRSTSERECERVPVLATFAEPKATIPWLGRLACSVSSFALFDNHAKAYIIDLLPWLVSAAH